MWTSALLNLKITKSDRWTTVLAFALHMLTTAPFVALLMWGTSPR
jgi:hypothetical protein